MCATTIPRSSTMKTSNLNEDAPLPQVKETVSIECALSSQDSGVTITAMESSEEEMSPPPFPDVASDAEPWIEEAPSSPSPSTSFYQTYAASRKAFRAEKARRKRAWRRGFLLLAKATCDEFENHRINNAKKRRTLKRCASSTVTEYHHDGEPFFIPQLFDVTDKITLLCV